MRNVAPTSGWVPAAQAERVAGPGDARSRSQRPQRDRDGFAEIVAAEHDRGLRLAYLLAGDRHTAEDALAEAFARTYEKWRAGKVDDVGSELRRSVPKQVKQVKHHRRSMARLRRHEPRCHGADEEEVVAREEVMGLLDRLPYRQRAAVVLRHYEGCSAEEVAAALGCRRGTVEALVSRGLAELRRHGDQLV